MKKIIVLTILLLVACTSEPEMSVTHDARGLFAADIAKHGEVILTSSIDNNAKLWHETDDKPIFTFIHPGKNQSNIAAVALSPNGKYALTATLDKLAIWDNATGKSLDLYTLPGIINTLALSDNGIALIALNTYTVEIYNIFSKKNLATIKSSASINSIAISKDGKLAITGGDDKIARVWDLTTMQEKYQFTHNTAINTVAISSAHHYALSSSYFDKSYIWNLNTGKLMAELKLENRTLGKIAPKNYLSISSAKFDASETRLLTGSPPGRIRLWRVSTGKLLETWKLPKATLEKPNAAIIYALDFNKLGTKILASSGGGQLYTWDMP